MRCIGFSLVGRFFLDNCLFLECCLICVSFFVKLWVVLGCEFCKILILGLVFSFLFVGFVVFVIFILGYGIDLCGLEFRV